MGIIKFGGAVPVAGGESCAACGLRDRCRDPRKSRHFACTFYTEPRDRESDPSNDAFLRLMRELVSSESVLSDPYNIDDRECALAPNFYAWCVDDRFLAADPKPYPWQIEVGLHLFGDICPGRNCSDQDWYDAIPHDCDVAEIPKRLSLRVNGRCPKCHKTRLDGISAGREKDYNTLIAVIGQRCITGDSLLLTDRGLVRIGDYAPEDGRTGWIGNDFHIKTPRHWRGKGRRATLNPVLESGSVVAATNFWVSKPECVHTVTLQDGLHVRGTGDHPIKTTHGWKTLRRVQVGDHVPISYNQNVWGRSSVVDSQDQARMLGFWVSEGSGSKTHFQVTNYDDAVLDLCRREVLRIKPDAEITQRDRTGCDPTLGLKRDVTTRDAVVYNYVDGLVDGLWRKSADKVIPRSILEAPKEIVCAFLQALFDGDGCCGPHDVTYCSLSYTLVSQLQVVLANAGVVSKMRRCMTWASNGSANQVSKPSWELMIKGPSLRVFRECIGFFSARKRDLLDVAISYAGDGMDMPCWFEKYPDFVKCVYLRFIAEIDAEWSRVRVVDSGKNPTVVVCFRYSVADYRRLESDNVCLSRSRLGEYWDKLRSLSQWYDLSLSLRARLLEFHDLYLNPNTYWTRVRSNRLSKRKHVTYDIHVPGHHRFMAQGILNHNSGKCLAGDSLVQTTRGLLAIRDIAVGDYVLVHGKAHRVVATKSTPRKFTVKVSTGMGFQLQLTPKHLLMTPTGWRTAKEAKTVMICTSDTPWSLGPYAPPARLPKHSAEKTVEVLSRCNQENASRLINAAAQTGIAGHSVLLTFESDSVAIGVQQFLLSKGIVASRKLRKLVLCYPWSERYADKIGFVGFDSARVDYVARKSNLMQTNLIGRTACDAIYAMYKNLRIDSEWHPNPRELQQSVWMRQVAKAGEMTHDMAAEAAVALRGMQTVDEFAKSMLISTLEKVASYDLVWDDVARVEHAGKITVHDIEVEDAHRFVANGLMAHNSVGIGFIISYHQHMLLKLKNPSAFYGIKQGTVLQTTIVGLNYSGAKKNVWEPLQATLAESPWYQNYNSILKETAQRRGEDDLYRSTSTYMYYKPAGLWMAPASPSRRNLRGRTSCAVVVDELGHFSEDTRLVNISGVEVWRALTNSLSTIRPAINRLRAKGVVNIPHGLAAAISSPWEVSDPIMQLFNAAPKTRNMYSMIRPTWEANPQITFKDLADDFILNPVAAWRDFGCRPPFSALSFIHDLSPFKAVIDGTKKAAAIGVNIPIRRANAAVAVSARLKWAWSDGTVPKIMGIDAGHIKNSFACTVAHLDVDDKLAYDMFVEVRPRHNMPVSFRRVYEDVIVPIVQKMNVKVVIGDRWEHVRLMDDLFADYGIEYLPVRLTYTHFVAFRDDLLRSEFSMPRPEIPFDQILNLTGPEESYFDSKPVAQFMRQCIRVVDVPGKTVEKPTTGNDDVWRAAVLAHAALGFAEVLEVLQSGDVVKTGCGALGASALSSGYKIAPSNRIALLAKSEPVYGDWPHLRDNPEPTPQPRPAIGVIRRSV